MQAQGTEGAQEEHRRRSDVTQVLYKCCTDVAQLWLQKNCPGVEQVLHGLCTRGSFPVLTWCFGAAPVMQRRCGGVGAWVAHYVVDRWSEDGA